MKKLLYAVGVMMLLGLTAACVDPVNNVDNPNYDPIKDAVTAKFYINIAPSSSSTQTKMTSSSVQKNGTFRGMENATLFTFNVTGDGNKVFEPVTATSYYPMTTIFGPDVTFDETHSNRVITLTLPRETNSLIFYGQAITGETDDEFNEFGGLEYTGLYKDLNKIGCNAMPRLRENSDAGADFIMIGDIILEVFNTLFKTGINNTGDKKNWQNLVFKLSGDDKSDVGGYADNIASAKILWSDFSGIKSGQDASVVASILGGTPAYATPLEQILGITYDAMVTLNEIDVDNDPTTNNSIKELRAGSGPALLRQAQDLYAVVSSSLLSTPMDDNEKVALCILREIEAYLNYFFVIETGLDGKNSLTAWRDLYGQTGVIEAIAKTLAINPNRDSTALNDYWDKTVTPKVKKAASKRKYSIAAYPFHFNLPMGAVTLVSGSGGEAYKYERYNIDLSQMGKGTMKVFDYTYPPALVYYGNSPIRITENNDINDSSFPNGAGAWETDANWTNKNAGWQKDKHVTINTRGVAMINNVHYGNALLATTVQFAPAVISSGLKDNNMAINGDPNKTLKVGGDSGTDVNKTLQLTGILIGGQPDHVGWCYLPASWTDDEEQTHTVSYDKMVYDKFLNGGTPTPDGTTGVYTYPVNLPVGTGETEANYTLVFDNYREGTQNDQREVYVALEFKNNLGEDFWGNANMVRNGGTFYLMGKLALTNDLINSFPWSSASPIMPPYYTANQNIQVGESTVAVKKGDTKKIVRVFMEDFITTAHFVIGPDALQAAYVTVPDLRTAKMSFGLSVDLDWKTGLEFNEVVLGK